MTTQPLSSTRHFIRTTNSRHAVAFLALLSCSVLTGCEPDQQTASTAGAVEATAEDKQIQFTDITKAAGIKFTHNNGAFGAKLMPESLGSGAAFIDYNNDGYQDLFLVNGRAWTDAEISAHKKGKSKAVYSEDIAQAAARRSRRRTTSTLYHNNGDGTFRDVTRGSGLDVEMFGMGATVGDYDNDGKDDLYVTGYGRNYLFHNEGRGEFREVAQPSGVLDSGWSTSAAWVDYDRDGWLDLFVCHYVQWTPTSDAFIVGNTTRKKSYAGPNLYAGEHSRLYRNLGAPISAGRRNSRDLPKFEDVSVRAGIRPAPGGKSLNKNAKDKRMQGKSLGVCVLDYNNDFWPDMLVANDLVPNYLFRNNKDGTFSEVAAISGVALNQYGNARAGMGVDAADIDGHGRESVLIGNFSGEMLGLYRPSTHGVFSDVAHDAGVAQPSFRFVTFGCAFVDVDNDSRPDIMTVNGSTDQSLRYPAETYAQPSLLLRNRGAGQFVPIENIDALNKPVVGRGLACADVDLDGDTDVLIFANAATPLLLRNDMPKSNNAIRLVLRGSGQPRSGSNRSGIGAQVKAEVGVITLHRTVRSGSSYLSQSELPLVLGLGQANEVQSMTIKWPSGRTTKLQSVAANQIVTVDEDRGLTRREPLQTVNNSHSTASDQT